MFYEDYVSLIDLVAVGVRHRRLVFGGTVFALLFSMLGAAALPRNEHFVTEDSYRLVSISAVAQRHLSVQIPTMVVQSLTDPSVVGPVYYRFLEGSDRPNSPSDESYLRHLRDEVIGRDLNVRWVNATRSVEIDMTGLGRQNNGPFIRTLIEVVQARLPDLLDYPLALAADEIDIRIDSTELQLKQDLLVSMNRNTTEPVQSVEYALSSLEGPGTRLLKELKDLHLAREQISFIRNNSDQLLTTAGPPLIYQITPENRLTMVLLTTLGAAVFFIVMAFVVEYIRTVRADPEEFDKLKAAWRRA